MVKAKRKYIKTKKLISSEYYEKIKIKMLEIHKDIESAKKWALKKIENELKDELLLKFNKLIRYENDKFYCFRSFGCLFMDDSYFIENDIIFEYTLHYEVVGREE